MAKLWPNDSPDPDNHCYYCGVGPAWGLLKDAVNDSMLRIRQVKFELRQYGTEYRLSNKQKQAIDKAIYELDTVLLLLGDED